MELQQIRPVGHKFNIRSNSFDEALFLPFQFRGYGTGTQALAAALIAVKHRFNGNYNSEVLLPAYTCPDVISACEFAGVKARLVDLESNSSRLNLSDLKAKISKHTLAIVAINFLGIQENINALKQVAQGITIIEDSAQGMSEGCNEKYWRGDLVVLSFGRGKPLNLMSGGALLYRDSDWQSYLPEAVKTKGSLFRKFTYKLKCQLFGVLAAPLLYYWITRLPGVTLGVTRYKRLMQLEMIPEYILSRIPDAVKQYRNTAKIWKGYHNAFKCISKRTTLDSTIFEFDEPSNLLRYPLIVNDRDLRKRLLTELKDLGATTMYQKCLFDLCDVPDQLFFNKDELSNAVTFSNSLITIPCHNGISKELQEKIIMTVKQVLDQNLPSSK